VYAAPGLGAAVADLERRLGVRLLPGGSHPAWGTRNALAPLGPTTYLEVIGPDPETPAASLPRLFGIATLAAPRLATWAAKGTDLARLTERARSHQIDLGAPSIGSRRRPEGTLISWQLTDPFKPRAGGILPFFIDWCGKDHLASLARAEIQLLDFHAQHPDPEEVTDQLRFLGIELRVVQGSAPALFAVLRTAAGTVVLT
jgi:hypothetical protein